MIIIPQIYLTYTTIAFIYRKEIERLRDEQAAIEGTQVECGCCCGDVAFENSVQCTEGHLFCKNCLQKYVEESVFGNGRSLIKCMNTMEACDGFFTQAMLRLSLPVKIMSAYDDLLAKDNLKNAQLTNLVTCPGCQLQVEMPENAGSVLVCIRCHLETCRYCGEENHVPLRCSEVEKKSKVLSCLYFRIW